MSRAAVVADAGSVRESPRMTSVRKYLKRADAFVRADQIAEALGILEAAIAEWPEDVSLILRASVVNYMAGDEARSLDLATQAAQIPEEDPWLRLRCAEWLSELGAIDAAEKILEALAERVGSDEQLVGERLVLLGHILERRGRHAEAEQNFRAALDVLPHDAIEGLVRVHRDNSRRAAEHLERSTSARPDASWTSPGFVDT
jgi:tetratricopeptide (TPR) repeat protein